MLYYVMAKILGDGWNIGEISGYKPVEKCTFGSIFFSGARNIIKKIKTRMVFLQANCIVKNKSFV